MRKIKKFIYNNTFISSFAGGIIFLIIIFVVNKFLLSKFIGLKLDELIILATFLAIIWYSLETRLLKNATNTANAIRAEPLLVLRSKEDGMLCVVNYGNSPAFNIKIKVETGSFNFISDTPLLNPLNKMEERILFVPSELNQHVETEILLCCDTFDEKVRNKRKWRYKIFTAKKGYYIVYKK